MIHYFLYIYMRNPFDIIADALLDVCVAALTVSKGSEARAQMRRSAGYSRWREILRFVVTVAILFFTIKTFFIQPFLVQQDSMQPTIQPYNYIIVDRFSYRFLQEPKRGDVVVFLSSDNDRYLIKRIVGLPGERITIKDTITTIYPSATSTEPTTLPETYVAFPDPKTAIDIVIPQNEYFVMGDNRKNSLDSRVLGTVSKERIVGRTLVRLFPFMEIGLFPGSHTYTE